MYYRMYFYLHIIFIIIIILILHLKLFFKGPRSIKMFINKYIHKIIIAE